jgi:hypothetical protein
MALGSSWVSCYHGSRCPSRPRIHQPSRCVESGFSDKSGRLSLARLSRSSPSFFFDGANPSVAGRQAISLQIFGIISEYLEISLLSKAPAGNQNIVILGLFHFLATGMILALSSFLPMVFSLVVSRHEDFFVAGLDLDSVSVS